MVALGALGVGASAVVLVALPYKIFDLDRYFVPKELALHLTALIAGIAAVVAVPPSGTRERTVGVPLTRVDTLLVGFLALSAVSGLFAVNGWLAARALALSVSGVVVFWVAQSLARAGRARTLLGLLAAAITVAAVTSLLQAYGVESELFSLNRSPGGTLGNRNFVAHIAAIGMPALIVAALRARRAVAVVLGACAAALVAAAVVLSRSRAAWVAAAIALVAILPGTWKALSVAREDAAESRAGSARGRERARIDRDWGVSGGLSSVRRRALVFCAATVAGIVAAVTIPNTLNWRSASPYLDSVLGVTNYRGGSGHGRIVQYTNTARLAATHPVFGVGPGNWAVAYPRLVPRSDPSLDPDDGMTANPWPSSDWAAFLSERGVLATLCLALALLGLIVAGGRAATVAIRDRRVDRLMLALALMATVLVVVVVGAFDAALLLPAPSLIAWAVLGALAGTLMPAPAARASLGMSGPVRTILIGVLVALGVVAVGRSAAQLVAMALYTAAPHSRSSDRTLELASQTDPGSYRIHVRLAEAYARGRSCTRARVHAAAARTLFPAAPEPRRLLAECGGGAVGSR